MTNIRTMVRGAYDLQKLRIQTGNRIVVNFKDLQFFNGLPYFAISVAAFHIGLFIDESY